MAEAEQQASNKSGEQNEKKENLEDLLTTLSNQIKSSDWLEHNTPEKFALENPEVAQAFKDAAEKSEQNPNSGKKS
ncbi:1-aminocyclopropane-1-carboxylate synthase homolog (arabidopsis)(non-functional) [Plakobranchus ocellatus]|uniref:1-aminocyclopropane-1-carboxylate synthase homolog (Arabidopsis)(Non-functional) n=1 Tax=Plakobranchus ocellatus TaxID=259542 RepID=A0AAV4CVU2_9GAST|nr:1-aminocyclopropane-1-carboxylate synthase homolog (arabidopsis)(non-functional) [Plakobranchus ocellatus]